VGKRARGKREGGGGSRKPSSKCESESHEKESESTPLSPIQRKEK